METSECLKTTKILRFAQDFGSGLPLRSRPLIASTCQRALKMGLRQLRGAVIVDGDAPNRPNQMSIVAWGGLPVCEGRHRCGL